VPHASLHHSPFFLMCNLGHVSKIKLLNRNRGSGELFSSLLPSPRCVMDTRISGRWPDTTLTQDLGACDVLPRQTLCLPLTHSCTTLSHRSFARFLSLVSHQIES
jgi:hypothetical protein